MSRFTQIFPLKPFAHLPTFDFMKFRTFWVIASMVLNALAIGVIGWHGLNFGIDFVGGKLVQVQTARPMDVADVRSAVDEAGFTGVTIQQYGAPNEFLIRLPGNDPKVQPATAEGTVIPALAKAAGGTPEETVLRRVEFVGPQVGDELKVKGAMAMLVSILAIMAYVWARFELRYGLGAIVALVHDVILTIGVMSILNTEITLTVLAAILTLIGYSLNDTIVIFDRIRENRGRFPNRPLTEVINMSVNQTLGRTFMTVATVAIVLLALFFLGGEVIHDFSFVLLVGIGLGTYSSVFVASPILLALEEWYREQAKAGGTPALKN